MCRPLTNDCTSRNSGWSMGKYPNPCRSARQLGLWKSSDASRAGKRSSKSRQSRGAGEVASSARSSSSAAVISASQVSPPCPAGESPASQSSTACLSFRTRRCAAWTARSTSIPSRESAGSPHPSRLPVGATKRRFLSEGGAHISKPSSVDADEDDAPVDRPVEEAEGVVQRPHQRLRHHAVLGLQPNVSPSSIPMRCLQRNQPVRSTSRHPAAASPPRQASVSVSRRAASPLSSPPEQSHHRHEDRRLHLEHEQPAPRQ